MEFDIFYSSIIGYKNIMKNKNSQDYCAYKKINGGVIGALSDGHSTDFFEYSDIGSKLACIASIEILESYIKKNGYDLEIIKNDLNLKNIQKDIYYKWKELIDDYHKRNRPIVLRTEYVKYSSTLSVVLINKDFRLYLNIGDSSILVRRNDNYIKILENNDSIVKSLGWDEAYNYIDYQYEKVDDMKKDDYIIIFSDGYSNGFDNYEDMILDLNKTIKDYNKNIFSKFYVTKNYKKHLEDISKYKSYDDITIMFFKCK